MRTDKEEHYTFHKGDLVCFNLNGKKTLGRVTGYVFYGADKHCQSPDKKINLAFWLISHIDQTFDAIKDHLHLEKDK